MYLLKQDTHSHVQYTPRQYSIIFSPLINSSCLRPEAYFFLIADVKLKRRADGVAIIPGSSAALAPPLSSGSA